MHKIAFRAAEAKQPLAAAPHFLARSLFRRLPARLADLPDDAKGLIGAAIDRRTVLLALDADGATVVTWAGAR